MTTSESHPNQTRLAVAALSACIAHSLSESAQFSLPKFEAALRELNDYIGETSTADNSGATETLRWTNEFLQHLKRLPATPTST